MFPSVVAIFPYYFGVGDHHYIVIDFLIEKFLGEGFILIYKLEMQRLTTKQPKAVKNYLQQAESLFHHYHIHQKVEELESQWQDLYSNERANRLNHIDQ